MNDDIIRRLNYEDVGQKFHFVEQHILIVTEVTFGVNYLHITDRS